MPKGYVAIRRRLGSQVIPQIVALLLLAFSVSRAVAEPARRVALVIGNAAYASAPTLANPKTDAKLIAEALKHAGFTNVSLVYDLHKKEFEDSLRAFRQSSDGAEVALLYYAGHGLEVSGRNWLIPVDARLDDERDLPFQAIDLDVVLDTVVGAKGLRVVILDACRDNPFTRSIRRKSGTRGLADRGLADIEVTGTLVLYAQRAGETARDGVGNDSPFAISLARRLPQPGVDIRLLVSQVRDDVLAMTANKQEPFSYGSLPGISLELVPKSSGMTLPSGNDPDLAAFNQAATINSSAEWNAYLRQYPTGRYALIAKRERDRLIGEQASTMPHSTAGSVGAPPSRPVSSGSAGAADLLSQGRTALAACRAPGSVRIPRGEGATRSQMLETHKKVQALDSETNGYANCLKEALANFKVQYASSASPDDLNKLDKLRAELNNAGVDRDQAAANDFNEQLRIFKAKQ